MFHDLKSGVSQPCINLIQGSNELWGNAKIVKKVEKLHGAEVINFTFVEHS